MHRIGGERTRPRGRRQRCLKKRNHLPRARRVQSQSGGLLYKMNGPKRALISPNLQRCIEARFPLLLGVRGYRRTTSPSPQSSPIEGADVGSWVKACWFATIFLVSVLTGIPRLGAAETAEQIIAAAKKEGDEIVFVAGSQTFGGKKGLTELEVAFNKKFRLTARIHFA